MIQKAVVKKILDDTHAEIEVQRQSACGHDCASCGGCGVPRERIQAVAINKANANVGEVVTIEGENKQIIRMALIVYTLPIIMFFVFVLVASLAGAKEGIATFIGCIGIIVGIFISVIYNKKVKKAGKTFFTIIRKG